MKTIKQDEYLKLNKALRYLEDILASMGIKEFSLSSDKHHMKIDTNADAIDEDLLYTFCRDMQQLHDRKFGPDLKQCA